MLNPDERVCYARYFESSRHTNKYQNITLHPQLM